MIRDSSATRLAATGLVAFTIGLGTAFLFARPAASVEPIVQPSHAIEQSLPSSAMVPTNYASLPAEPRCNPFDVSEVAMEEVLDQMIRRGWRAPTQGAAVAFTDFTFGPDMQAIDPNSLVQNARLSGTVAPEVAVAAEPVIEVGDVELTPPDQAPTPPPAPAPAAPATPPVILSN